MEEVIPLFQNLIRLLLHARPILRLRKPTIPSVPGDYTTNHHDEVVLQAAFGMVGRVQSDQDVVLIGVVRMADMNSTGRYPRLGILNGRKDRRKQRGITAHPHKSDKWSMCDWHEQF